MTIDVSSLLPSYRSHAERHFAQFGPAMLADKFGSKVLEMRYEPMTFKIPGGKYTPDFLAILETGSVLFVEIKGSVHQKGYRDSRSKLRAAAEVYPLWTWVMVMADKWTVEVVK